MHQRTKLPAAEEGSEGLGNVVEGARASVYLAGMAGLGWSWAMPTLGECTLYPSPKPATFATALILRPIWRADRLNTLALESITASPSRMASRVSTACGPR